MLMAKMGPIFFFSCASIRSVNYNAVQNFISHCHNFRMIHLFHVYGIHDLTFCAVNILSVLFSFLNIISVFKRIHAHFLKFFATYLHSL